MDWERVIASDENPTVEIEVSEYDKLSTLEKGIFDAFIMNVNDFYNPSEVRFLGFTTYFDSTKSIYVKIQGTNRLGGTLTKWYSLQVYDNTLSDGDQIYYYDKGDMTETGDWWTIDTDSEVNVGRLNKALTEYWEDLGL
ncbi:MAG: hypothetical protein PHF05_09765 [Candidatus Izemoplasmatales bacterium]|nr:hypothetical protein [Candidatus Izemoplasmatales bacterium]